MSKFRWLPSAKVEHTLGYILKVERTQIGPCGEEKKDRLELFLDISKLSRFALVGKT